MQLNSLNSTELTLHHASQSWSIVDDIQYCIDTVTEVALSVSFLILYDSICIYKNKYIMWSE
jgi:hypothetical protein